MIINYKWLLSTMSMAINKKSLKRSKVVGEDNGWFLISQHILLCNQQNALSWKWWLFGHLKSWFVEECSASDLSVVRDTFVTRRDTFLTRSTGTYTVLLGAAVTFVVIFVVVTTWTVVAWWCLLKYFYGHVSNTLKYTFLKTKKIGNMC